MSNNSGTKSRVIWIDIARFIGILAIVYGHTVTEGVVTKYLYTFHIPLFFLLQGVVFSITKSERRPFLGFLKNKAYTLLLPYYCFALISTAVIFAVSKIITLPEADMFLSEKNIILKALMGYCEANRPLWFLPCAFVLLLLAYLIINSVNKLSKVRNRTIVLAAISLVCYALLYVTEGYTAIKFLPLKADGAIFMLPFFIVGYSLNEYGVFQKVSELSLGIKIPALLLLLISGAWIGLINDASNYLGNYYGNVALMYVSALLTGLGICMLSMLIPNVRCLTYVGQHTLGILLMHKFPVLLFQKAIPFTAELILRQNLPTGLLVSLFSILLCCVAELVIDRIFPPIIGKRFKKRTAKAELSAKQNT